MLQGLSAFSDHSNMRTILSYDKGVSGYLDFQTAMNAHVASIFTDLLKPTGAQLDIFLVTALEMAKYATASEIQVRTNQRLIAVKRSSAPEYSDEAVIFNEAAMKSANRGLTILTGARREMYRDGTPISLLRDLHVSASKEFQATLSEARAAFLHSITEFNFTRSEDFTEVLQIWDEASNVASGKGMEGLFSYLEEYLTQFIQRRSSDERGTSPHSPLPWWKYVVIAVMIGAAIFAIIACFWWFACTWVWPALSAAAPWVFGIIDRGC